MGLRLCRSSWSFCLSVPVGYILNMALSLTCCKNHVTLNFQGIYWSLIPFYRARWDVCRSNLELNCTLLGTSNFFLIGHSRSPVFPKIVLLFCLCFFGLFAEIYWWSLFQADRSCAIAGPTHRVELCISRPNVSHLKIHAARSKSCSWRSCKKKFTH
jgi:hypothetical protein